MQLGFVNWSQLPALNTSAVLDCLLPFSKSTKPKVFYNIILNETSLFFFFCIAFYLLKNTYNSTAKYLWLINFNEQYQRLPCQLLFNLWVILYVFKTLVSWQVQLRTFQIKAFYFS